MMTNTEFIYQLRRKKTSLQRKQRIVQETDVQLSETLIRRIELINIVLAEFSGFRNRNSLKNLLHRPKF